MKGEETVELMGRRLPAGPVWLAAGLPLGIGLHYFLCGIFGLGAQLLFHEGGHALAGWALGCPAIPTAAGFTTIYPQRLVLALVVWGALGWLVWRCREVPRLAGLCALLVLVYPALAFTGAQRLVFDVGGHLSELACASAFAWITLRGGIQAEAERPFYGMFAWYAWTKYLLLMWRLLTDPQERTVYLSIAIAGDNDLVRVADWFRCELTTVALVMLLLGLVVPPAVVAVWWTLFRNEAGWTRLRRLLGVPAPEPPRREDPAATPPPLNAERPLSRRAPPPPWERDGPR